MSQHHLSEFLLDAGFVEVSLKRNVVGHLVVEVVLNDVVGEFLVDTGASGTVVEQTKAEMFRLNLDHHEESNEAAGAGASGISVIPSSDNHLKVGDCDLPGMLIYSMSLDHVNMTLQQHGAERELDGVLGADFLSATDAIIDFASLRLYARPHQPQ